MSQRINRCSHCGCDEPIHNDIDGKLYCNNCGMSLEKLEGGLTMTNADAIRSMDDKKLADFVVSIIDCWHCPKFEECTDGKNCPNVLLAWLKQEHKEG